VHSDCARSGVHCVREWWSQAFAPKPPLPVFPPARSLSGASGRQPRARTPSLWSESTHPPSKPQCPCLLDSHLSFRSAHVRAHAALVACAKIGSQILLVRPDSGQPRTLSLPCRAGNSTEALPPGSYGFMGPVPSATLDKRRGSAANANLPRERNFALRALFLEIKRFAPLVN